MDSAVDVPAEDFRTHFAVDMPAAADMSAESVAQSVADMYVELAADIPADFPTVDWRFLDQKSLLAPEPVPVLHVPSSSFSYCRGLTFAS